MKEPFVRQNVPGIGPEGYFTPEANPEVEWFFNEPSIATREYQGELLRLTERGWEFYVNPRVFKRSDSIVIDDLVVPGWHAIYPKVSYFRQALQVLGNTWRNRNSPYKYVQEFEDADSPFTLEYELGEYWLVKDDPWYLVPVNKAEQISNINALEIHKLADVYETFEALQDALAPLRDSVYGVIFTTEDGRRTRVRPSDFDWKDYDARS